LRTIRVVPDLETLTAADFAPLLHERFRIGHDVPAPFDVELIEVAEVGGGAALRRPFSLVFRGGPSPPLPQRIYRVEHEELGAIEIFLVPIARDERGMTYEAVFT
jgi:hypothetical protein